MKIVSLLGKEAYYILIQEDKTYLSKNLLASRILTSKLNYLLVKEVEFIRDYYQNLSNIKNIVHANYPSRLNIYQDHCSCKSFLKIEYYQELSKESIHCEYKSDNMSR